MGPELKFENLITGQLQAAEGTEVVLSHVTVPPNKTLPKHYHPGEEFAFVVEGALTLLQDNEEPMTFTSDQACVVPYKKVHTIQTGDKGCRLVVFRVHESGSPERVLVD